MGGIMEEDTTWSPTVDALGKVIDEPYPSIANFRQVLAVVDGLWNRMERQENTIEFLKEAILAMQPRYHTLMHTFQNQQEAEMAWHYLQVRLAQSRHSRPVRDKPTPPMPPMPVGPQYTSPYVHKDGSPVIPQYSTSSPSGSIKKFEGIDIDTDSH
jgi:hypothetical protein